MDWVLSFLGRTLLGETWMVETYAMLISWLCWWGCGYAGEGPSCRESTWKYPGMMRHSISNILAKKKNFFYPTCSFCVYLRLWQNQTLWNYLVKILPLIPDPHPLPNKRWPYTLVNSLAILFLLDIEEWKSQCPQHKRHRSLPGSLNCNPLEDLKAWPGLKTQFWAPCPSCRGPGGFPVWGVEHPVHSWPDPGHIVLALSPCSLFHHWKSHSFAEIKEIPAQRAHPSKATNPWET